MRIKERERRKKERERERRKKERERETQEGERERQEGKKGRGRKRMEKERPAWRQGSLSVPQAERKHQRLSSGRAGCPRLGYQLL